LLSQKSAARKSPLPNILKFSIGFAGGRTTNTCSFTEHQILDQCKTKRTENFFKFGEGSTLNNRRSHTGEELQSFV
jgi:hypothetical protein